MDNITVLGVRGSVPVFGGEFLKYGGSTTSFLLCLGGEYIAVDAGSGLMRIPEEALRSGRLPLLITHAHLDHILGLPLSPCAMTPGARLDIYARERGGLCGKEQLHALLRPPLWPVGTDALPAEIEFFDLPERLNIGNIEVAAMDGLHPGGVTLLRLEDAGKRVVIATDCTFSGKIYPKIVSFAQNADILIADGQYSPAEWAERSGFGHSTWEMAARLGLDCGAKRTLIVHHDPARTDAELDEAAREVLKINENCAFGREGDVIEL